MMASCSGELIADTTSIFFPHRGHNSGFSVQTFAISFAQFRFLTLTNSLSPSSSAVMTFFGDSLLSSLIHLNLRRSVVEMAQQRGLTSYRRLMCGTSIAKNSTPVTS